jgi:hypothetical protein
MRLNAPTPGRHDRYPPANGGSLLGLLAFPLFVLGLLWAVSYPALAATLVTVAVLGYALVRFGLPALARRLHGRIREIDIPGFGTVRFRVTAR